MRPRDLAAAVAACWPDTAQLDLWSLWFGVNDTYVLRRGSEPELVVRVYRADRWSEAAVGAELRVLDVLEAGGAQVAPAVRGVDGSQLLILDAPEGPRAAAVFPFVKGTEAGATAEGAAALGTAAAQVHAGAAACEVPERTTFDLAELLDVPLERIALAFPHRSDDVNELRHIADRCRTDLDARLPELPTGFLHGDLQGKNAIIADDGSLTLLDFDECGSGWLIDDLAVYLMCSLGRTEPVEIRTAFLDGYQEIRVLTPGEITALPSFVVARDIWAMGWQLRLHESSGRAQWLDDRYLDWNLEFLRKLGDTATLH